MRNLSRILLVLAILASISVSASSGMSAFGEEKTDAPIRWRNGKIQIALSAAALRQAPNIKFDSDVSGALRRSLNAWESVGNVEFEESISEKQNVSAAGIAGDGVSLVTVAPTAENALLFVKNPDEAAATTRVFFDAKGFITEADIVLNPYQQFSTDGTFGTFDLESTLTHEIGHLLGLEHSPVMGSTMHENYGKNGIYGLQNFGPRTLAELDKASIRSLYGDSAGDGKCCGAIGGKIFDAAGKALEGLDIWAEDARTGQVRAEVSTNSIGAFVLNGLSAGTFKIYAQKYQKSKNAYPSQEIGEVTVVNGETAALTKRLKSAAADIDVKYLGFNGQLSGLAVPINAGKTYTVYLGGKNLNADKISVRFSSPFLKVVPGTISSHDYGDGLSVVSFEVSTHARTPIGEYTVFVDSAAGGRSVIVGGIAVRRFSNPFSNLILSDD